MIERTAQAAMIVVFERDEPERLQNSIRHLARRAQNFSHAMHRAGLGLKRDLNKVALPQRLRQPQQASGGGDGLKFSFGAAAVFQPDGSQDGIS